MDLYLTSKLREDGIIKIKETPKTYKSVIIGNKIANYLEESSSTDINIYVLAKALDITVSTIHTCVNHVAELRVRDYGKYDDRGRKVSSYSCLASSVISLLLAVFISINAKTMVKIRGALTPLFRTLFVKTLN